MTNLSGSDIAKHENDAKWEISFVGFVTPIAMCPSCHPKSTDTTDYKSCKYRKTIRNGSKQHLFSIDFSFLSTKPVVALEISGNFSNPYIDHEFEAFLVFFCSSCRPSTSSAAVRWCLTHVMQQHQVMLTALNNLKIIIFIKSWVHFDGFIFCVFTSTLQKNKN